MLQRIQSLFLIITALGLGLFLGTNTYVKTISASEKITISPFELLHVKDGVEVHKVAIFYIAVVTGLALLLTIFSIFQYKNRTRQMLFVALNSLIIAIGLGIMIFHINNDAGSIGGQGGDYHLGFYAAFVALFANWLANRFIRKDDKMVKDSERMR